MEKLNVWITYHDDELIEKYNLKEEKEIHLFNSNNTAVKGENINYLNKFYSELVTFYWVWKNHVESKYIAMCHYRRLFDQFLEVEPDVCQVMNIQRWRITVREQYKSAHNYHDYDDIIDILNKQYGKGNKYSNYMLNGHEFIPCCCFVMCYENFERLCEFVFPVLFEFDKMHNLNMNVDNYRRKAEIDFRYENIDYQQRAMSFLAERLVSCYIVCNMKAICLDTL